MVNGRRKPLTCDSAYGNLCPVNNAPKGNRAMPRYTRKSTAPRERRDVHQEVTDKIIAALESGAAKAEDFRAPWHKITGASGDTLGGAAALPVNLDGRAYRGINVPLLWISAAAAGYD